MAIGHLRFGKDKKIFRLILSVLRLKELQE